MLKAKAGDTIILGLSRLNVDMLVLGKPIEFDGAQVDLPGKKFVIFFGENELAMAESLGVALTPDDKPAN